EARAAREGPAVVAGQMNDGDPEMDRIRREERRRGAERALDQATVDENGTSRPLTPEERSEVMDAIDLDQPVGGEPNDGWLRFHDRNGDCYEVGDPARVD